MLVFALHVLSLYLKYASIFARNLDIFSRKVCAFGATKSFVSNRFLRNSAKNLRKFALFLRMEVQKC